MLNICVNMKEHLFKVESAGSTSAIAAEVAAACGLIYANLKNVDRLAAEEFRTRLVIALSPGAPAWLPPAELTTSIIMVAPGKDDNGCPL